MKEEPNKRDTQRLAIEQQVILVGPILLTHDEIKASDEDSLIFHKNFEGYTQNPPMCVKGLPVETGENTPLLFLVPHLTMQAHNFSVSLLNISSILYQLLMASWADKDDI